MLAVHRSICVSIEADVALGGIDVAPGAAAPDYCERDHSRQPRQRLDGLYCKLRPGGSNTAERWVNTRRFAGPEAPAARHRPAPSPLGLEREVWTFAPELYSSFDHASGCEILTPC